MPFHPLSARTVWITGASSGIGEALAVEAARRGARVVLSGRRIAELDRVAALCAGGPPPVVVPLDLTRPQEFAPAVREVREQCGRIDVLVNNGGVGQRALVAETLPAVERAIMEVNFFGATGLTKAVLPVMLHQRSGTIVAVSSVMGYVGLPRRATYAASKHALRGWFDSLREEVRGDGLQVLVACPGYVRTRISENAFTGNGGRHDVLDGRTDRGIDPAVCARAILDGVERGREEVVVGGSETWAITLRRLAPGLFRRLLRRAIARGRF